MVKRKTKIGEKIECKVSCVCQGKCIYRVNNKKINNYVMDFCSEYLHIFGFTKESEV